MNTRIFRNGALCAVLLAGLFALAACAPPVGTEGGGNLRVLLSGANRTIAADTLVYHLEFRSAGGETLTRQTGPGAAAVTVTVRLGSWTIHVDAYTADGVYYGSGDTSLVVEGGKTNNITVPMTFFPTWYVAQGGEDSITRGSEAAPFETVSYALSVISDTYAGGAGWSRNGGSAPAPARILIKGTITETGTWWGMIEIRDGGGLYGSYPPIILAGYGPGGTLDANNTKSVLYIYDADVTLGPNLTLTRGNASTNGGGVCMVGNNSSFAMTGGAIRGNTSTSGGGGVYSSAGGIGSFTMTGGTISSNTGSSGGGVYLAEHNSFTMTGGAISGNQSTATSGSQGGGGVYMNGGSFIMTGGTIGGDTPGEGNTAALSGGGVYLGGTAFTMTGGVISGNTAGDGGGVWVYLVGSSSNFTMSGGTISGNAATAGDGGGVYVGSTGNFAKTGGTIYGDTDMIHTPGSSENTAASGSGHAVYIQSSPKERNSTAGPGDNLDSEYTGSIPGGGWE
ncbi:MAG: hypothetical protein LBP23_08825 [Treponema sp.]|nr:hypothetical protein [Treponema sp.]